MYYKRTAIKLGQWPGVDSTRTDDDNLRSSIRYRTPKVKHQSSTYTIIAFGICSIVWSILRLIIEIIAIPESPGNPDVGKYLDHLSEICSLCSQMIFFYHYNGGVLPNIHRLHYSIAVLIGIKLCSWIGVALEPLWDLTDEKQLFNTSTIGKCLEFSEEFLRHSIQNSTQ